MKIDLTEEQIKIVHTILMKNISGVEVWAFGSRVKFTAKKFSDLDLVIVSNSVIPFEVMFSIKADFEESNLPFKVDVLDWSLISDEFKKIISEQFIRFC